MSRFHTITSLDHLIICLGNSTLVSLLSNCISKMFDTVPGWANFLLLFMAFKGVWIFKNG